MPAATGKMLMDPATLMRIRSMEMRAKVIVEGFLRGIHRSPYHGFSVEFTEYREYTPGDDPRYLDWRLYARSDRYYIKKYEDETNLRCQLLVDGSRSMAYGSGDYPKAEYGATLAAALAALLFRQGDAVGLTTFDAGIGSILPARNRPGHLHRLMLELEKTPEGRSTDLTIPLQHITERITKRSLIVLISDLLAPIETLPHHLGLLRAHGHDVVVFQTLDRAELELPFEGPTVIEDMETGQQIHFDPHASQAGYQQRLVAHLDAVAAACGSYGIDHHLIPTDQPLELALLAFLQGRAARGRQIARGGRR